MKKIILIIFLVVSLQANAQVPSIVKPVTMSSKTVNSILPKTKLPSKNQKIAEKILSPSVSVNNYRNVNNAGVSQPVIPPPIGKDQDSVVRKHEKIVPILRPPKLHYNFEKWFIVTKEAMLRRFLSYVNIDSQSIPAQSAGEFTMTNGQLELARFISEEIKSFAFGLDCQVSDDGYVYVNIPSNIKGDKSPVLGFSCHLDVTPECISSPVNPIVIYGYKGGDIKLNDSTYIRVDSPEGKHLRKCIGDTIIHTDGTTLLGADDKCGCTIAVSLIEFFVKNRHFKHGKLQFVFCPNEDVGLSAARIDTTRFNPEILFDIDGEGFGGITRSNFTAKQQILKFTGHDAHPGNAKELKYGDALAAASYYIAQFPLSTRPERSSGLEGYIHPWNMVRDDNGDCIVSTRVRYFLKEDGDKFDQYLDSAYCQTASSFPNVKMEITDNHIQYENVAYSMHPKSMDIVMKAAKHTNIPIYFKDERGGTTASMFCAKGMKGGMCLFSGQHGIHSVREYAVLNEIYFSYVFARNIIIMAGELKDK